MNFEQIDILSDELREAVGSILRADNRSKNLAFFTSVVLEENAPKPLNVVVFDAMGTVVGGLIAETQFEWLKVSIMAVAERERRRGIGRRLLELAEQEAKARDCRHAYLDTMDYQAPDFYRKLGYQPVGKLENWDSHGHTKYLFTKDLTTGLGDRANG